MAVAGYRYWFKRSLLALLLSPLMGCVAYQKVPLHNMTLQSYAIEGRGNCAEMLEIRAATQQDLEMYGK